MSILKILTAKVFEPLLAPTRYKGAFGGRGSGKSHFLRRTPGRDLPG
ncbi:50S ribosomal protein L30P (fragment) [Bradyrhizobium sp. STM 3809]